ncbi:signal peptidase II [Bailinhaonella thermotolerans]|uniref:Lipoprotein signal peptidase n=1 Tax=Bailinhaonella thermotolerans TaxID=1070861 RepID=A0A3A4AP63_9ACTN|nr:signal peptidase II [Bailinhaonella thermotolerans]
MNSEDTTTQGPGAQAPGPHSAGTGPRSKRRRCLGVFGVTAAVALALDFTSKEIVLANVEPGERIPVLGEILQLTLTFNSGAAFSIGTGFTLVLTLIAIGVVIAILRYARNLRSLPWALTLGLLLGGAVGNLVDRIFRPPSPFQGHVVDWIELPKWPVFNLADSAIVCGGVLAVFLAWRGYQLDGTRDTGDGDGAPGAGDGAAAGDDAGRAAGEAAPGRAPGEGPGASRTDEAGADGAPGRGASRAEGKTSGEF